MTENQVQLQSIRSEIQKNYIFDQDSLLDMVLVGFLSGGHILIEGPPGTGKTLTAKVLARYLSKQSKRIQFTTDLLPADILGAQIFSPETRSFLFVEGPIFADIVIADEINRAPPRTQSALLEAMAEKQVSTEGITRALPPDFFVVATQNPRDFEGTFPLPEVQLDRFLMKIVVRDPSKETNIRILKTYIGLEPEINLDRISPTTLSTKQTKEEIEAVRVDESLLKYIANIVSSTQQHPELESGGGVRAAISFLQASRSLAYLKARDFVTPDDIKILAVPVLCHRIKLNSDAQLSDKSEKDVIEDIISKVEFPK